MLAPMLIPAPVPLRVPPAATLMPPLLLPPLPPSPPLPPLPPWATPPNPSPPRTRLPDIEELTKAISSDAIVLPEAFPPVPFPPIALPPLLPLPPLPPFPPVFTSTETPTPLPLRLPPADTVTPPLESPPFPPRPPGPPLPPDAAPPRPWPPAAEMLSMLVLRSNAFPSLVISANPWPPTPAPPIP